MDLTIVKLPARPTRPYRPGEPLAPCYGPKADRFPDNSIDMGTGFDCFDTLAHTLDPRIQGKQSEPDVTEDHDGGPGLRESGGRVVALHLPAGAVPGHLFRLPHLPPLAQRPLIGRRPPAERDRPYRATPVDSVRPIPFPWTLPTATRLRDRAPTGQLHSAALATPAPDRRPS